MPHDGHHGASDSSRLKKALTRQRKIVMSSSETR
jgi:hypothetical protein